MIFGIFVFQCVVDVSTHEGLGSNVSQVLSIDAPQRQKAVN